MRTVTFSNVELFKRVEDAWAKDELIATSDPLRFVYRDKYKGACLVTIGPASRTVISVQWGNGISDLLRELTA